MDVRTLHVKPGKLAFDATVIQGGVGLTGKTVVATILRRNDGRWYDGTTGWSATVASVSMGAVDATNHPGLYGFDAPSANVDSSLADDGYSVMLAETTTAMLEYIDISTAMEPGDVWDALLASHVVSGSFGESVGEQDDMMRHGLFMNQSGVFKHFASGIGTDKFYLGGGSDPSTTEHLNYLNRLGILYHGGTPSNDMELVLIGGVLNDGADYFPLTALHDAFGTVPVAASDELYILNTQSDLYAAHGIWKSPFWTWLANSNVTGAEAAKNIADLPGTNSEITGDSVAVMLRNIVDGLLLTNLNSGYSETHIEATMVGTTTKFYNGGSPTVGVSASYENARAMLVYRSGLRVPVKILSIADDGNVHFVLALASDGTSPLLIATGIGDQLIITQPGSITVNEIMEHSMTPHNTTGTFGDHIRRILGLRQSNMRVVYTAWSTHNQPTAGYVLIYDSAADRASDTDPWALATGRYDFTATYNGTLQLTEYTSDRTS